MTLLRSAALALALIAVPMHLSAAPVRKATTRVATRDWSQVTARTPTGSFIQGNPNARVKLVEYLSLTCPHCAHFEGEAIAPLTAKYIRPGLVSYEVRHALRDPFDFAGTLLVRCGGPQNFFATLPKVFAQQDSWFAKAQAWAATEQSGKLPPDEMLPRASSGAGFPALLGMAPEKANACLTDHDEQTVLTAMAGLAWRLPDFPGTPAFAINGALAPELRTWADLDARLTRLLKTRSPT